LWREQRIARLQPQLFLSYFKLKFTFHDVEPFILIVMEMFRRTAFIVECILRMSMPFSSGDVTLHLTTLMPNPRCSPN